MIVRLAVDAMGTRFELVLSGEDEFFLRAAGEAAIEAIEEEHRRLSVFDDTSLVGRINAAAGTHPVGVDGDLMELLVLCGRVWKESGGAFDPAIGRLMNIWGHRSGQQAPPIAKQEVGESDAPPTFSDIVLDRKANSVAFLRDGIGIDLGGIAKGYALDRAAAIVREAGVKSALLHGGTSSLVAIGSPPDTAGWRIRLRFPGTEDAPAELLLRDRAASVSAPEGRVSERGAGHIIDPRTGRPTELMRVAVACTKLRDKEEPLSGALADAWATALVVLGDRPGSMPREIGSAVLTAVGVWRVSSALEPVFVQDC